MTPSAREGDLFGDVPDDVPDEILEVLARGEGVRIERIVSRGQRSPDGFWYDQDEDEWVLVVAGAAVLELADGRRVSLGAGDWMHLPARERHRVHWTDPDRNTVWVAVFWRPEADV